MIGFAFSDRSNVASSPTAALGAAGAWGAGVVATDWAEVDRGASNESPASNKTDPHVH